MANIAFEPDGLFLVRRKMFAIVTAEATGRILVSQLVSMNRPIQALFGIMDLRVPILQLRDRILDGGGVLGIVIGIVLLIIRFQVRNRFFRSIGGWIGGRQNFDAFLFDFRNTGIDLFV